MKKLITLTALSTIFCTSLAFAGDCGAIAKACKSAGYSKGGDKKFWQECMHPILLGQSVKEVTIDPNHVKACRDKKITELQEELKELQGVK